jgi:hypothetical protein
MRLPPRETLEPWAIAGVAIGVLGIGWSAFASFGAAFFGDVSAYLFNGLVVGVASCALMLASLGCIVPRAWHGYVAAPIVPMHYAIYALPDPNTTTSMLLLALSPYPAQVAAGAGAFALARHLIRTRPRNRCERCGYSLEGLHATRCPECGEAVVEAAVE